MSHIVPDDDGIRFSFYVYFWLPW